MVGKDILIMIVVKILAVVLILNQILNVIFAMVKADGTNVSMIIVVNLSYFGIELLIQKFNFSS